MGWKSVDTLMKEQGFGTKGYTTEGRPGIYFGTYFNKGNDTSPWALNVRITEDITRKMRWMTGDRLALDIDQANSSARIRRVSENDSERSYKMGKNTAKATSHSVKMTWLPGLPSMLKPVHCEYQIVGDSLVVSLPKDRVSWKKTCIREDEKETGVIDMTVRDLLEDRA